MGLLEELQQQVDDVKAANLPEYSERLRALEVKIKDLEYRLAPFLEIIRVRGER